MKEKNISLLKYLVFNILNFYILPLFINGTGSGMVILLVIIPLICLCISAIYGKCYSFNIVYPFTVAISFIPAIWIYLNESAWIYVPAYGIIALLGNLIGASIYKYNSRKNS